MCVMAPVLPPILVDDLPATRRSLRVALVTETYPPEVNGVALTLQRVVDGLHARHHDIQLVRPRQTAQDAAADSDRYNEVLMRGIPIPRYPDLKMGAPSKAALARLWALRRPDLVYIATEGPLGWSALQAARRLKLPVCSDFRTNFHAYSRHYGVGWLHRPIMAYLRKFHNHTAFTMVPTEQLRQELTRVGFERLVVAPRGVDTALFDPVRRSDALRHSWGADAQTPVALYVGRLAPEKNLGLLVAAYRAMRELQPGLRLVLVGDGPARQALAEVMPEAVFAGTRCGEVLAQHYASADLFVFPSMTETFGNVTVEALASGLPVLAYDHAAAAGLVRSGHNGMLARLADAGDFVRLGLQLVADLEQARRMGRQARLTACSFGWDRAVDQIESVLHATLAAASPSTPSATVLPLARAA